MPFFLSNHIIIKGRTETLPYTSNLSGRSKIVPRSIEDREGHGINIRTQFNSAVADFRSGEDREFVYLVFTSPAGFFLDLEKLGKNQCRLASYREKERQDENGVVHVLYEAAVYLNKRAISVFLTKIHQYLMENTPLTYNKDGTVRGGNNPLNQSLIANIETIRAATLLSFWQEPEMAFPDADQVGWWEIWLSRLPGDNPNNPIAPLLPLLQRENIEVGKRYLKFPEHWVYLMKGSAEQLGRSILYTDRLAEIRKPKETAEFFTYLEVREQNNWIADLRGRVDYMVQASNISICLLDTGVNITNPLIADLVPERNLDAVEPGWSKADTHRPIGHGTPMAGLSLYGDLSEALAANHRIEIVHQVESVKLIDKSYERPPELYGAATQEAIERGALLNPTHKRILCMAITSEAFQHNGRPSSWSSAIDQSLFENLTDPTVSTLFMVSSGNLALTERSRYPLSNHNYSIQDPGQSFNAITVGAYTLKDVIDHARFPGAELLARRGAMSPSNTTSMDWESDWCRKPDIVMEGGNQAIQNDETIYPDSLQLLSTARGGIGSSWLTTFRDTSAATALAARFAAILYHHYPTLWPETIRALIVHSADWTPAMLQNRTIEELRAPEKEKLIQQVGYGVPNLENAKYSANNALSLIAERQLKPFKKHESEIKTDQFQIFNLPWPTEVLTELFDTQVRFKITLSYYIEPNPGKKTYEQADSYRSHGLRFKMIDSGESPAVFKARISKAMRTGEYAREGGEHWILGAPIRDKGSIHKDIWQGTAADLATRNKVAIHPVGGWWRSRKKHKGYENSVRYSLIMTIETPAVINNLEVDIYTPVQNLISIEA
jgi:hypothetical protein